MKTKTYTTTFKEKILWWSKKKSLIQKKLIEQIKGKVVFLAIHKMLDDPIMEDTYEKKGYPIISSYNKDEEILYFSQSN